MERFAFANSENPRQQAPAGASDLCCASTRSQFGVRRFSEFTPLFFEIRLNSIRTVSIARHRTCLTIATENFCFLSHAAARLKSMANGGGCMSLSCPVRAGHKPRWCRARLSLRALLLIVALVSAAFGLTRIWMQRLDHERAIASQLTSTGNFYVTSSQHPIADRLGLAWLLERPEALWQRDPTPVPPQIKLVPELRGLVNCQLVTSSVDDELGVQIARLPRLEELELGGARIGEPTLRALGLRSQLRSLTLSGSTVSDQDLRHLAGLTKLQFLNLFGTSISDAGVEHLLRIPSLETLDLGYSRVTDAGIARLGQLPNLRQLSLSRMVVSEQTIQSLRQRLPRLQLISVGSKSPPIAANMQ
jgi:hypothetical protein